MNASRLLLTAALLSAPLPAFAQNSGSHGGDECEREFIRIGKNLRDWIQEGGPRLLKYRGTDTPENYSSRMLALLDPFLSDDPLVKAGATRVECTSEPIRVDGIEKTCAWKPINENRPEGQKIIQCHHPRFLGRKPYPKDDPGQFRESHHEWAGIADLEPSVPGGRSDYWYSDQVTSQGEYVPVFMIRVHSHSRPTIVRQEGVDLTSVNSEISACQTALEKSVAKSLFEGFNLDRYTRKHLPQSYVYEQQSVPVNGSVTDVSSKILHNRSKVVADSAGFARLEVRPVRETRLERIFHFVHVPTQRRDIRSKRLKSEEEEIHYEPLLIPNLRLVSRLMPASTRIDDFGSLVPVPARTVVGEIELVGDSGERYLSPVNTESGAEARFQIDLKPYKKCLNQVLRRYGETK